MRGKALHALWLLTLGSCAVGPSYHAPHTQAPKQFAAQSATDSVTSAEPLTGDELSHWWHQLNDPELDSLVDRAIQANPDIEIALTRLQEVRTQQAVLIGDALPSASAGGFSGAAPGAI